MGTVEVMSAAGDTDPSHFKEGITGITATIMTIQGWGGQTMMKGTIYFSTGGEISTDLLPVSVSNSNVTTANNGQWGNAMEMITIANSGDKTIFGISTAGIMYSGKITNTVKYP